MIARGWWGVAVVIASGCGKRDSKEAESKEIESKEIESKEISASVSDIAHVGVPDCKVVIASEQFRTTILRILKVRDDTKLYPDKDAIWPHRQSIPVCWENANHVDGVEESRRGIVRDAVAGSWESTSQVHFTGWGDCNTDEFTGVRISIEDTAKGSYTKALGVNLDGVPAGMVLDLTMHAWTPRCGTGNTCLRQVAIHEFGHALGFAHEQNRPDEPAIDCRAQAQGHNGTCVFCAPDHESIMSYCNPNWNNSGSLSRCDRCGVAALYGPAGTTERECADF